MMASKHAVVASSSCAAPEAAAYRQVVAEATTGDEYLCALHPRTMKKLSISDGDAVLLKSKRRRETRCVAVADEECPERMLKINEAVRSDLRVRLKDVVFVYACPDAKYVGGRGSLRPVDEVAAAIVKKKKPSKVHRMLEECSLFVAALIVPLYSLLALIV